MSTSTAVTPAGVPANLDAERCVLGAILVDNGYYNEVVGILGVNDFLLEAHRRLFETIGMMLDRPQPVDLVTLVDELRARQLLERVGGPGYVSGLTNDIPAIINVPYYARLVLEKSQLRTLMSTAERMRESAVRGDRAPRDLVDEAMTRLFGVAEGAQRAGFLSMREILQENYPEAQAVFEREAEVAGVMTGFTEFDDITLGMHPANLLILGARPSVGKTSFALNVCQHAALRGAKKIGVFSLEMSREELALRLLCSQARVNLMHLRKRMLKREDQGSLAEAFRELIDAPIFIDDDPGVSVTEMRSKSRRLRMEHGLDLLVIDHLQLVLPGSRYENRNQELSSITRSLKALAKELQIPVFCLSQLSRPVKGQEKKRPQLSDLRESGAIEQDADVVSFLFREELYEKTEENSGLAELIVAKNRNGPAGQTITLVFDAQYTRFYEHSPTRFD